MKQLNTYKEIDEEIYLNSFVLLNEKKTTVSYRASEYYDSYLRKKLDELSKTTNK